MFGAAGYRPLVKKRFIPKNRFAAKHFSAAQAGPLAAAVACGKRGAGAGVARPDDLC
jgi:hypothetical protein